MNTPRKALPDGGTSIKGESKSVRDFSRVELVRLFLQILEREYIKFKEKGFAATRNELKSYSCTLGRYISITTSGKGKVHGKAINIKETGVLVVKLDNGKHKTFLSGDVTLIR